MEAALQVLRQYWGYTAFRPAQEAVIRALLAGREVLALLPTGGGKSICYQVPGLVRGGVTLVISPLIALMRDQVEGLRRRGLAAASIDSSMPTFLRDKVLEEARTGQLRFLYVAPERAVYPAFVEKLRELPVTLVAVDEAHCISQWGHDFRASYLRLAELRMHLPEALWVALTATATPRVVRDIVYYLGLRDPVQVRESFYRKNFYYAVVTDIEKDKRLYQSVHKLQGSGIVYVSSRAAAVEVAQKLRKWGFSALPYHAGMEAALRAQTQEAWIQEKVRLIVATTAFGMGIDKPNTRFVIHYDLALEPEAYFQEVGRAGRDGELAYAIALYSPRDVEGLHRRLEEKYPSPDFLLRLYQVVKQEAGQGAIRVALPAWAEWLKVRPGVLRRAFHLLAQEGLIFWRESWDGRAYLRSLVPPETWQAVPSEKAQWILRLGGAALFQEGAYIDLAEWTYQLGWPQDTLYKALEELQAAGLLHHTALRPQEGELSVVQPLPSPTLWQALRHKYSALLQQAYVRARFMRGYYSQQDTCRPQYLLRYFEESIEPCGQCDVCRGYYQRPRLQEEEKLVAAALLSEVARRPCTPAELRKALREHFPGKEEALLEKFLADGQLEVVQGFLLRWRR
ncbi:MAG: ATP-dependent DNA helicase RecQ [Bacteroidia bacterium]|nr:MAG: ATP-dependent DNA helicase RecQ [Bacteroidia bacterium]